jgi:CubicO group peptidase (beta-lactamase class C family)
MTDSVSGQASVEAETPALTTETATQSSQNVPEDIESRVRERVQESLEEHDLPGATVAVVTEGDVAMTDGFGVADRDTERPVEATTPFRIGSISKPVVWTVVARLAERGDLDLETPVSAYLDDEYVSWDDPVTLADLATHSAGFESTNQGMWYADLDDVGSLTDHLYPMPAQVRPPGEVGSYANHGPALAGHVVETVTGSPFATAMDDLLLGPAGMSRSSFHQPPAPEVLDAHASAHGSSSAIDGKFVGLGIAPSGALSATAQDMARFMQLHLNGGRVDGEQVVPTAALDLMHQQWFTNHEALPGSALGLIEGYRGDVRILRHNGGTPGGFASNMVLVPELGFGLFVSYNSDEAATPREAVPEDILDEIFGEPDVDVPAPEGQPTRASELPGTYRVLSRAETTHDSFLTTIQATTVDISITDDGALLVDKSDEETRWVETEPLVFQEKETGERLAFGADGGSVRYLFVSGTVTALERVSWQESARLHGLVALGALLGLGSGAALWSPSREEDQSRREWLRDLRTDRSRAAKFSVFAASIMFLAFVVVTLAYLAWDPFAFLSDPNFLYRLLFVAPLTGAVASLAGTVLCVHVWRSSGWRLRTRVHYTVVALSALVMTGFLWYWHLLLPP